MSGGAVTIVGAGPVGSLLAILLARRGLDVDILERRGDMRAEAVGEGRSINLALSVRGLHALARVGLAEVALRHAIPMRGRMVHAKDGALALQRYGRDDSECIHSMSRAWLNATLMSAAEAAGRVRIHFHQRVTAYDAATGELTVEDVRTQATRLLRPGLVIGADGSASVVRAALADPAATKQERLGHGYKELTLPEGPGGAFRIEKHALHIWPRGEHMLIALPNQDGSFTCTLFLPFEGEASFESLDRRARVESFFEEHFPDARALIDDRRESFANPTGGAEEPVSDGGADGAAGLDEFFAHPTGSMVTVKCAPWHAEGRALLLGDAAHAIVPFFGQGLNCGFEDCVVFDEMLAGAGGLPRDPTARARLFADFEAARRTNTDAIADMAVENFVEMRDLVGDARFLFRKEVERVLQRALPGVYVSRYALVTFERVPYRVAYEAGIVQAEILDELCRGLARPEDVDLRRAEELARTRLGPLLRAAGRQAV